MAVYCFAPPNPHSIKSSPYFTSSSLTLRRALRYSLPRSNRLTMTAGPITPKPAVTSAGTEAALHVHTPLIESPALSAACGGRRVLLKLDNLQPGGSFKMRGHGHLVRTLHAAGVTHFVSSSGGNAGAAVAEAGRRVGARVTIVVPSSTPPFMRERLRAAGAAVRVHGAVWDEADAEARAIAAAEPQSAKHVSPFDDPLLWDGHASLVDELRVDLAAHLRQSPGSNGNSDESAATENGGATQPCAIAVAVGGGGLLLGTIEGLRRNGWEDVPIIAGETAGADSFAQAAAAGKIVTIDAIDSIAKSLGALAVSEHCMERLREGAIVWPTVVSDRAAVEACSVLAVKHRFLVEPACGAAIAAAIQAASRLPNTDAPLVIVVCGGNMASPALLHDWVKQTGAAEADL